MTKIVHITTFRYAELHNPANGRYCLESSTLDLQAQVKLFELPGSVLYNPYGGGQAPVYPQKFTVNFMFRGSTPAAVQTMYANVTDQLGYTASLFARDANNSVVFLSAILEKIVRTDKWTKNPSSTIKFQLTFQPLSNIWGTN